MNPSLTNYFPTQLNAGSVRWLQAGQLPFTDPFFDETIRKMRLLPENRHAYKSTSTPEMLAEWASSMHSVQPSAIIFHVSRCGSTLLSQLLGLNTQHIVLAEVPFFDELLRERFKKHEADYTSLLPYAVQFYGQKRTGKEEGLFIKADSWHLFFYEEWRKLYPDIPFILLYRQPDEVIHSQMKRKGLHVIPGMVEAAIFRLGKLPCITEGHANYIAAVLAQYYQQMRHILQQDALCYAFDYKDGIDMITADVLQLTGHETSPEEKKLFKQRLQFDAKEPGRQFSKEPVAMEFAGAYFHAASEAYHILSQITQQKYLHL